MNYKHFDRVPINRKEIEQAALNIEDKYKSNTFTWNGQFSPQFVEVMLDNYSNDKSAILDPFLGSGTSMRVAAELGIDICGIELNPAAYYLSSIYLLCKLRMDEREMLFRKIETDYLCDHSEIVLPQEKGNIYNVLFVLKMLNEKSQRDIIDDWKRVKDIVNNLPECTSDIKLINADSRNVDLPPNTYDLVFTSPPYINVYNYHQQYRKNVEDIGIKVLDIAVSEIGSNRKNRSNRFYTVAQYCLDITELIFNILPSLKDGSRLIIVIGRSSKVLGISFSNSRLLYDILVRCFKCKCIIRQERSFKNKYGKIIYEDILHFEYHKDAVNRDIAYYLHYTRRIVKQYIRAVLDEIGEEHEKYSLLNDMFENIKNIEPSKKVSNERLIQE